MRRRSRRPACTRGVECQPRRRAPSWNAARTAWRAFRRPASVHTAYAGSQACCNVDPGAARRARRAAIRAWIRPAASPPTAERAIDRCWTPEHCSARIARVASGWRGGARLRELDACLQADRERELGSSPIGTVRARPLWCCRTGWRLLCSLRVPAVPATLTGREMRQPFTCLDGMPRRVLAEARPAVIDLTQVRHGEGDQAVSLAVATWRAVTRRSNGGPKIRSGLSWSATASLRREAPNAP
jgi:hypothetical protein